MICGGATIDYPPLSEFSLGVIWRRSRLTFEILYTSQFELPSSKIQFSLVLWFGVVDIDD